MSDNKAPAFQFYPADFLEGTAMMSALEIGVYIQLLCLQWSMGAIPADFKKAGKATKVSAIVAQAVIESKFELFPDGQYRNRRLERVRLAQEVFRFAKSKGGSEGARKRWQKDRSPNRSPNGSAIPLPLAKGMANDSSPSPSPTPPSEKEKKKESLPDDPLPPPSQPAIPIVSRPTDAQLGLGPDSDPNLAATWPRGRTGIGEPDPSNRIRSIHEWFSSQFEQPIRMLGDAERQWFEFFKAGFSEDDFKKVFRYLHREIKRGERKEGALKLRNLLQPESFQEDLALACKNWQKPASKQEPQAIKVEKHVPSQDDIEAGKRYLAENPSVLEMAQRIGALKRV